MILYALALTCWLWMSPQVPLSARPGAPPQAPAEQLPGQPTVEKLTADDRYDDYPSIAAWTGRKAWLVWQSYSERNDEIRLRQCDGAWKTFTRLPGRFR